MLCDVSGSVANFAQFTLMLVFALRDQFQKVRAFTFVDHVHEVTDALPARAPTSGDVMADLAASTAHAALWGRTNYGRAFTKFAEQYADALGPEVVAAGPRRRPLQLQRPRAAGAAGAGRRAPGTRWWLNPEHRRHWDTGDSAAGAYGEVVPMVECRNLTQLGEFVRALALTVTASPGHLEDLARRGRPAGEEAVGSQARALLTHRCVGGGLDRGRAADVVEKEGFAATEVSWSSNCTVTCWRLSALS